MSQEPYRGIVLANRLLFPSVPRGWSVPPRSKREEGIGERELLPSAFQRATPGVEGREKLYQSHPESYFGGVCVVVPSASGSCESWDHEIVWLGRGLKAHLIPRLPWAGTPATGAGCSGGLFILWDGAEGEAEGGEEGTTSGAAGSATTTPRSLCGRARQQQPIGARAAGL